MTHFIKILILMTLAFLTLTPAQESLQIKGDFVGTVRLGPDAGAVWQGLLTLNVTTDGAISGTLEEATGTISVSGTVTGQSITLVFAFADGKHVIGTGGLNRAINKQPSFMGGTLSGPSEGDIGDWGYGIGG
jgi:hypothetical protein